MKGKYKYALMFIVSAFLLLTGFTEVQAATLIKETVPNVFYTRRGGGKPYGTSFVDFYSLDGKTVYCIEAGQAITTDTYVGKEGWINSPYSDEINQKIQLIGYYGYDYPGHQTQRYRLATQSLIWEVTSGQIIELWTEIGGYGDFINLNYERNQIMKLVNAHYQKPSFENQTKEITLGATATFEDTNGILSRYEVTDSDGANTNINGNTLSITPTKVGETSIILKNKSYTNDPTTIFVGVDNKSQKMGFFGLSDPLYVSVNVNALGGKIKITKVDAELNTTTSQGQASLIGAKYNVIDSNNNIVSTLTIGSDLTASTDYLPLGTYTIKEVSAPIGYYLDQNTYTINVDSSETINVIVKDQVIKGKIKINKVDSKNNSCQSSGMATLIGAKYEVRDHNNNVVDTITIGNDCSAISKELPYGKYTVKEISAPTGYHIDNNIYTIDIKNSDTITITSKEELITSKIKIVKYDSITNSCKASGMATLIGAKYEIRDHNNNVVDILTIGNDCSATSKELPYGKYTVKEVFAPTGYYIDETIYSANIMNDNIITITSKENVIKSKIQISKVDSETNSCLAQGEGSLIGAKYEIRDHNNNIVDTLIISEGCKAISKELPYGKYTIKEVSAPTGYYLDENTYTVNIENNKIISITSKEDVIKGRIKINKIDSETKTCKAQGQASLIGAKFVIKNNKNEIVDTLIIGEDCSAISKYLPYGEYKIEEIDSPTGYYLNTEVFNVFIKEKLDYSITAKEEVIKNYISILKQYDYVNGNTTFLNAEENITFEIFYPNGTKYGEITTDKNGYASLEIPYGIWKFHQVNTHTGFEKIYDFYITVNEDSEKEQYYNILNNKISAYLQVVKKDSETGKTIALPNTTFKILNTDTNQYVTQFVAGKVYDKFYTDESGILTTYLKLEAGNYKLVEIESPKGYLISNEGLNFTIGSDTKYNYTTYGAFIVVDFKNTPIKGQLEIYKTGEKVIVENGSFKYETINLDGVKFELYASTDIKSADGNHIYYNKGDLIETLITDKNGYVISKQLPLGKYYLIEVETKDNHILNTKEYHFELTEKDNKTSIVYNTYKVHNYLEKGELQFTKLDLVDGTVIPNVEINIYTENDELIFTGLTDESGKITINNLFVGKFYIVEKKSADGYVITDEKVYFEIKENGEIIKAEMTNKKITSPLKITKNDEEGNLLSGVKFGIYDLEDKLISEHTTDEFGYFEVILEYGKYYLKEISTLDNYVISNEKIYFDVVEDGVVIEKNITNDFITGSLEITKVDFSTSEPLPNTVIEVYTENNELIFTGITDEFGKITIEGLRYGKYYFIEKEAPVGYILSDEKMYFEIKEDGEIVKSTITNEKEIIKVPNTLSNSYITIISVVVLATGIVLLIINRKKNK